MLALVFSKLILIIIFVIGLGVLGGMGSATGGTPLTSITGEITGLLILLVAGFSPWMALRLVHFTGDHMATMGQSASHASAGASTVVGAPQKAAQMKYSAMTLGDTARVQEHRRPVPDSVRLAVTSRRPREPGRPPPVRPALSVVALLLARRRPAKGCEE